MGAPIGGLIEFFDLNLHRGNDPGLNISTQFFGRMYNLDYPLPWYNTLLWTAVTVPVGILLLAGVGLVSAFRSWLWGRLPTCQNDKRQVGNLPHGSRRLLAGGELADLAGRAGDPIPALRRTMPSG